MLLLSNVCNEAALIAARDLKSMIELTDFDKAIERVVAGKSRNLVNITILWNVCNEAALIAARDLKSMIELTDFDKAIERVEAGKSRNLVNIHISLHGG